MIPSERFNLSDLERRLASVVRFATITAVDAGNATARVTFGGETSSAWLRFSSGRSGGARVWSPPAVGEQVLVFSPSGDTGQGVIMGSLPSAAFPAPSGDGGTFQIDLAGVSISVSGGAINITSAGPVTITGDLVVTGDVTAGGISLQDHTHGGVIVGGDQTLPPA